MVSRSAVRTEEAENEHKECDVTDQVVISRSDGSVRLRRTSTQCRGEAVAAQAQA